MSYDLCRKKSWICHREKELLQFEKCSSRNSYLFCLVCFSICMNISQTVHFQFMIFPPVHFPIPRHSQTPFLSVSLHISGESSERVCANIPAEWRPHIIFCFCFSFMQTPKPLFVSVLMLSAHVPLKIVDRRNRHCHWIAYIVYSRRRRRWRFFSPSPPIHSVVGWCRNVCFDDDVCSPRVILPISAAEKRKYNCTQRIRVASSGRSYHK